MSPVRLRRAAALPAAAVFLVFLFLSLRVLAGNGWDPLAFVLLTPEDAVPGQTHNIGYDGRFVYHIANNDFGDTTGLDQAIFRYQRILYPLLVKVLSFGQVVLIPWAMLLINLAAAGVSAYLLGLLLQRRGVSPWWGLVPYFSLGYLIAMRMDLLEPLALALVLAGLLAFEQGQVRWAAAWFACAVLAKELALVALVVLVLHAVLQRKVSQAVWLGAAAMPFVVWYGYLFFRFGIPPEAIEKSSLFLLPFAGFFAIEDRVSQFVIGLWVVGPALLFGFWAAWDALRERLAGPRSRDALLVTGFAALIAVLPLMTWTDPLAVLRWALGFLMVLVLWLASSQRRGLKYVAALMVPSALIAFLMPGLF